MKKAGTEHISGQVSEMSDCPGKSQTNGDLN